MMSDYDVIRTALAAVTNAVDTAEADTNAVEDGFQAKLSAARGQAVADAATIATLKAELAKLQPVPVPPPAPVPATTGYGVNASSTAQHATNAAIHNPVTVWRYYQQPGEPIALPKEYTLTPGQVFAYSDSVNPRDKAAGKVDTDLRALFAAMKTGYYCPRHEPEDNIEKGEFTLADYHAGWERVSKIAREFPGIRLVPILMDFTIRGGKGRKSTDYLPGDYDLIGTDAYTSGIINGKPFGVPIAQASNLFDPTIALAKSVGKPWGAFEIGVGNAVPGQARLDALKAVSTAARTKGAEVACYFMQSATDEWAVDSASVAAWKAGRAA